MKKFGENIKLYRQLLGLKQGELAALMGVNQPRLSRWESGVMLPSMEGMQLIAEWLGIRVVDLFEGV